MQGEQSKRLLRGPHVPNFERPGTGVCSFPRMALGILLVMWSLPSNSADHFCLAMPLHIDASRFWPFRAFIQGVPVIPRICSLPEPRVEELQALPAMLSRVVPSIPCKALPDLSDHVETSQIFVFDQAMSGCSPQCGHATPVKPEVSHLRVLIG